MASFAFMRPARLLLPIVTVLLLNAGCTGYNHQVSLNETERSATPQEGTASVDGSVSVKMEKGDVANGAEDFIYLIPVTPYSTEWFEHVIVRGHTLRGQDPRGFRAVRRTVVGNDGRFQFTNIAAGDYFLSCTVSRGRPPVGIGRLAISRPSVERVDAYALAAVKSGEAAHVVVTRP